jgi:hypothetical protein
MGARSGEGRVVDEAVCMSRPTAGLGCKTLPPMPPQPWVSTLSQ